MRPKGKSITAVLTLGLLLYAPIASADWQNTHWGMSAVELHNVQPESSPVGHKKEEPLNFSRYEMQYDADGHSFTVEFLLIDNRLYSISLSTLIGQRCADLRPIVLRRYGEPKPVLDSAEFTWYQWKNKSEDVAFMLHTSNNGFTEHCLISFTAPKAE